jgi:hypothetical protein
MWILLVVVPVALVHNNLTIPAYKWIRYAALRLRFRWVEHWAWRRFDAFTNQAAEAALDALELVNPEAGQAEMWRASTEAIAQVAEVFVWPRSLEEYGRDMAEGMQSLPDEGPA